MSRQPTITAVLFAADGYESVRLTLCYLQRQTIARSIELLLYAAKGVTLPPSVRDAFAASRVGYAENVVAARYRAVKDAQTPIIAYCEDHSFPAPDWAQTLVRAHLEWDAVGPAMVNPTSSRLGWADLLLNHAGFVAPVAAGSRMTLPSHNTSYKKAVLQTFGAELYQWLWVPYLLQRELVRRGYRLYLTDATAVRHINTSKFSSFVAHKLYGGHIYGAIRSRAWPWWRRALYVLVAPLIPLMRLRPILARRRALGNLMLLSTLPWLLVGVLVATVGEVVGYLWPTDGAQRRLLPYETERVRHIGRSDFAEIVRLTADVC